MCRVYCLVYTLYLLLVFYTCYIQVDFLEDRNITDVIVLQTVLQEVGLFSQLVIIFLFKQISKNLLKYLIQNYKNLNRKIVSWFEALI